VPVATLKATNLYRERAGQVVLAGVSLTVAPGDRIGVVGPNGVGKTTLLRTLAGLDPPEAGRVELTPPGATVGYLAQERERRPEETVEGYLRRSCGVEAVEARFHEAALRLAQGDLSAAVQDEYAQALEHHNRLDPGGFEARAAAVLVDLGTAPGMLGASMSVLSGGEMARVGLAAIILSRFDVTLLDEPTNDLDFDGLARLEEFVLSQPGGLVIVSHDRAFLARTISSVVEIDPHTHSAGGYDGGWSAYLQEKQSALRHAQEAYEKYHLSRQTLLDRAEREKQWATSGVSRERRAPRDNDKAQRDFRINRTEHLAARARRTERAIERMEEVDKPWEPWQLRYTLRLAPRAGAVVASLSGAVVDRGAFHLGPVDLLVEWGSRMAVTGPNGSGKTTLVQALLGYLPLTAGSRSMGSSVVPGELGQERDVLLAGWAGRSPAAPRDRSGPVAPGPGDLLSTFLSATGMVLAEARSLLAKFGLGAEEVDRALGTLSPGERTRAQLACFQAVGVNFLVLDEPTNHPDLPAIEQLEAALASYDGTLLIVTHDRSLLEGLRLSHHVEVAGGQVKTTQV
jgi:ATPase subunit of ABC transporter with duplicated ATPase domains